jgi:hypothetical protein
MRKHLLLILVLSSTLIGCATPDLAPGYSLTASADKKTVTWNMVVRNLGPGDASGPFRVVQGVTYNATATSGPQISAETDFRVPAGVTIKAGQQYTVPFPTPLITPYYECPARYWITLLVDTDNQVSERNKANNSFEDKNFCILP